MTKNNRRRDPFRDGSMRDPPENESGRLALTRLGAACLTLMFVLLFLCTAYYHSKSPIEGAYLLAEINLFGGGAIGYLWGRGH